MLWTGLAIASLVLPAVAACSGSSQLSPASAPEFNTVTWPSLPFPASGELPTPRQVVTEGPYSFTQADVLFSEHTTYTASSFQLAPLPNSLLLLGVNTGTALPAQVTVEGTLEQVYIGLADYGKGRWDWRGPFDAGQSFDLLDRRYQSPAGGTYIALAASSPGSGDVTVTLDTAPQDFSGSWNVLCWLAADNYLAPTAYELIQDLETTGSTAEINILAGYDINPAYLDATQLGAEQVQFIKVVYDAIPSFINTVGDPANQSFARSGFDSGDPAQLAAFADWAETNFPADHTALLLFGFGDGWRSLGAEDEREPLAHAASGVLADYFDGGVVISAHQDLAAALAGHHFDLLLLDASSGGQFEALYEYRGIADWAVASQITVPAAGFPYADWLTGWQAAFPQPVGSVGWRFVEAVDGRYGSLDLPYFTNNLYNLAQTGPVVDALLELQADCEMWPDILKPQLASTIKLTRSGGRTSSGTLDLRLFLTNLKAAAGVQDARLHCDSALLAVDRFATYGQHSTALVVSGLSIYLPGTDWFTPELQAEYFPLAFNIDAGWLDWLGGLDLPPGVVVLDWQPGWKLIVEYADAGVDAELEVFDPQDHYGRPTYTSELTGIIQFSEDNQSAASTEEWAELLAGGGTGAYAFDVYHRGSTPENLDIIAHVEDEVGALIQDLGSFTAAAGQRVNIAALRLVDYGTADGPISPGDRIELTWSDAALKCELRVRNPLLEIGGVSFPEGYAGTMVFGPTASVSGAFTEWGRLSTTAPAGDYQVLAYVHDIATDLPVGGAQVELKLYDGTGALKQDLGSTMLTAADAGTGTVIFKPLAVLNHTE